MGWWGTGVMEGDTPYDAEYCIFTALVGEKDQTLDDEKDYDMWRDQALAALKAPGGVEKVLASDWLSDVGSDSHVYYEALAYLCMIVGAPLDLFKDKLLLAIAFDIACAEDSWKDPGERKAKQLAFLEVINAYDGKTPTNPLQDAGLLDTFASSLAAGKQGLLNKNK